MKIIKSNQAHRNPSQPQPPRRAFVTTPTQRVVEGGHETESGVGWDRKVSSKYNNYFYLEIRQQNTNREGKSLKIVSGFCIGWFVICKLMVGLEVLWLDSCPLYLRPEVISKALGFAGFDSGSSIFLNLNFFKGGTSHV